ncbi:DUF5983 family protein [Photobacterium leiognathi]|uniref:DUF5983 family protein n=1 Tax=Photobacterium leiognathi TaxID=553611 RepID=UPI002735029A|nr:hypothetical protein [Photobacterium leiognathi]
MFKGEKETLSGIAVSTAHLSDKDKAYLNELACQYRTNEMLEMEVPFIAERRYGYILKLYSEQIKPSLSLPYDNLINIINAAIENKYDFLEFDCDAQTYSDIDVYE